MNLSKHTIKFIDILHLQEFPVKGFRILNEIHKTIWKRKQAQNINNLQGRSFVCVRKWTSKKMKNKKSYKINQSGFGTQLNLYLNMVYDRKPHRRLYLNKDQISINFNGKNNAISRESYIESFSLHYEVSCEHSNCWQMIELYRIFCTFEISEQMLKCLYLLDIHLKVQA